MRVAILSRNPNLYSTRRLVEAGTQRGHQVDVIDTMHCYMDITSSRPSVRYNGKNLPYYDAVIPRIGASVTFYGTSVVRQFEMMGTYCINESVAISRSRDKLRSLQLLSRKGIGMPRTGFAYHPDKIDDLIKNVGGAPVVIKLLEGTQGIGVVLADTQKTAEAIIEAFMGLNASILVQEYIKEALVIDTTVALEGVLSAEAVRSRSTGDGVIVELTVKVAANLSTHASHEIADQVEHTLKHKFDLVDVFVHIEPEIL